MPGVLVVATLADGTLSRSSLELVGGARILDASLHAGLIGALLGYGPGLSAAAEALHRHGVPAVYRVDHPALDVGQADAFLIAAEQVARVARPDVVLLSADTVGREVAPRLAHRLQAALVTECVELAVDAGDVVARRQAYGGRALATYAVRRRPVVLSVKPRALDAAEPAPTSGSVEDVAAAIDPAALPTRVKDVVKESLLEVGLEDAPIVVGGGRGLGGPEGFAAIQALAEALGGAVGSSRPPADAGWVPISWQIGQTGKTIRPALYIAVGISGATQHVAGMAGSRTIVAINRDPDAPIFAVAHFGIVGDYREVIPPLIAKVKELKGR